MLPALTRLGRVLESDLMPVRCPFCGTNLQGKSLRICRGCTLDLPRIRFACAGCGIPVATTSKAQCAACQNRPMPFSRVIAPFMYEFPLSAAIRALKFRRRMHYLPALSVLLLDAADAVPADVDALLPVPLHPLRMSTRGFNQARELAMPVGRQLGLPVLNAVRRCRHTRYQSGLAYPDRQRNLSAAFAVRDRISARHVLLVDDVMTTGATAIQIARLLLAGGVEQVSVLVLARALVD